MSKAKHHIVIPSRKLAEWLDSQPGTWWNVDGDPLLTSEVDFPCPNEELAEGLRKHDGNIMVFTRKRGRSNAGEDLNSLDLDDLADTENLARLCLQPTGACTINIVAVLFRFTPSSDNQ